MPIDLQANSKFLNSGTFLCYGASGSGKCIVGGTRLLSSNGRYERIDDIVKWGNYSILAMNNDRKFKSIIPSDYYNIGYSKTFRVQLADGRSIIGTPEHPILTPNGFVKLVDLKEYDDVLTINDLPYFGDVEPLDWEPELLAFLIADGNLTQGSPSFTKNNEETMSLFLSLIQKVGDSFNYRDKDKRSNRATAVDLTGGNVKNWLIDLGLWGKRSNKKIIPNNVFSWKKEFLIKFLRTLFSCDGTLYKTDRKDNRKDCPPVIEVQYSSSSYSLIQSVAHLLRRFGITNRVRKVKGLLNGIGHGGFELKISTMMSKSKFLNEIGINRSNENDLKEQIDYRLEHNTRPDSRNLGSGIWIEKVKSIEYAGDNKVYDITVPELHNFISNDIISHNTRFCGSFPRPLFLCDQSESGWVTLEGMSSDQFFEPDKYPTVEPVNSAEQFNKLLRQYEPKFKTGELKSLIVDSLTFYADSYLTFLSQKQDFKDLRQLYQALYSHIRYINIECHKMAPYVVWTALVRDAVKVGEDAGPLLPGKSSVTTPAKCSNFLYFRAVHEGNDQTQYEIHTTRYANFPARVRGAPINMKSPLTDCTFKGFCKAVGKDSPQI